MVGKSIIVGVTAISAAKKKVFKFEDHWFISKKFIILGKLWLIHGLIGVVIAIVVALMQANVIQFAHSSLAVQLMILILVSMQHLFCWNILTYQ